MTKKLNLILIATSLALLLVSCASTPKETPRPAWVDNPKQVFEDELYISRVGEGYTKAEALADANVELAKYFGQDISSSVVGTEYMEDSSDGYANKKTLATEYKITFDTTLFAVDKTKPWYDTYTENYYVCAYVNREEAFNVYKPTLQKAREEFYKFFDEAMEETDFFKQKKLLETSQELGEKFLAHLNFVQIIIPSLVNHYKKDYSNIATVNVMLQKLKSEAAVNIRYNSSFESNLEDTISKHFTNNGFNVSNDSYNYVVDVEIEGNKEVDDLSGMIILNPVISITMKNKSDNTTYFAYTKTIPTQRSYHENKVIKATTQAITAELSDSFVKELQSFLNK